MLDSAASLPSPDAASSAEVAVVGLGYVGLPLLLAFARTRTAVGVDVDATKLEALRQGHSYLQHVPEEAVSTAVRSRRLHASPWTTPLAPRAWILCVPTRAFPDGTPDLSSVEEAARDVGARLQRGQLVVLESSVYPGTTERVLAPLLESASGLRAGVDFHLACSPERTSPGDDGAMGPVSPKLLAGLTPACTRRAVELYRDVVAEVVPLSRPMVAELAKVHENTFRAVNVALVNELKRICMATGVDVHEVLDAAATKPFGYQGFEPGPGVGGRCVPLMAHYLAQLADEQHVPAPLTRAALEVNAAMPAHVVDGVRRALLRRSVPMAGARVLVVGASYKRQVADCSGSPALEVLERLNAEGVMITLHDPLVPSAGGHVSVPLTRELVAAQHAVLILTDHAQVDWRMVASCATLIVDTRRTVEGLGGRATVVKV